MVLLRAANSEWTAGVADSAARIALSVCALGLAGCRLPPSTHGAARDPAPAAATELRGVRSIALFDFGGCASTERGAVFCWGAPPTPQMRVDSLMLPDRTLRRWEQYPWPAFAQTRDVQTGPGWLVASGDSMLTPSGRDRAIGVARVRLQPDSWDWCVSSAAGPRCLLARGPQLVLDSDLTADLVLPWHRCRFEDDGALRCARFGDRVDSGAVMNQSRYEDLRRYFVDASTPIEQALQWSAWTTEPRDPRALALSDEQACVAVGQRAQCLRLHSTEEALDVAAGDSVAFAEPLVRVVGGVGYLCALDARGAVFCWGADELVAAGGTARAPARVALPEPARLLEGASRHACVVGASGRVYCWGESSLGGLGNHSSPWIAEPRRVVLRERARAIGVGMNHSCAQAESGAIDCWGDDSYGQIGAGPSRGRRTLSAAIRSSPTVFRRPSQAADSRATMRVSAWQTCGCDSERCACTGVSPGQWIDPRTQCDPALDAARARWSNAATVSVRCGDRHACALVDGAVYCWGRNDYGQSAPDDERVIVPVKGYRVDG